MGMRVHVTDKMAKLATTIAGRVENDALSAAAALLQREIMVAAMGMSIWDTGTLINSHTRRKGAPGTWHIVSPAEYSVFVHEGTSRMQARPWFEQGITAAEPRVLELLQRAVNS